MSSVHPEIEWCKISCDLADTWLLSILMPHPANLEKMGLMNFSSWTLTAKKNKNFKQRQVGSGRPPVKTTTDKSASSKLKKTSCNGRTYDGGPERQSIHSQRVDSDGFVWCCEAYGRTE